MEQRLSVVTLGVGDLDRSRGFYEQGLGWSVGAAEEKIVFFQLAPVSSLAMPEESKSQSKKNNSPSSSSQEDAPIRNAHD